MAPAIGRERPVPDQHPAPDPPRGRGERAQRAGEDVEPLVRLEAADAQEEALAVPQAEAGARAAGIRGVALAIDASPDRRRSARRGCARRRRPDVGGPARSGRGRWPARHRRPRRTCGPPAAAACRRGASGGRSRGRVPPNSSSPCGLNTNGTVSSCRRRAMRIARGRWRRAHGRRRRAPVPRRAVRRPVRRASRTAGYAVARSMTVVPRRPAPGNVHDGSAGIKRQRPGSAPKSRDVAGDGGLRRAVGGW